MRFYHKALLYSRMTIIKIIPQRKPQVCNSRKTQFFNSRRSQFTIATQSIHFFACVLLRFNTHNNINIPTTPCKARQFTKGKAFQFTAQANSRNRRLQFAFPCHSGLKRSERIESLSIFYALLKRRTATAVISSFATPP